MYIRKLYNCQFNTINKLFCDNNKIMQENKLNKLKLGQLSVLIDKYTESCLDLTITVTTKCDLHCVYCFENSLIRRNMTLETAKILMVQMIKRKNQIIPRHKTN